MGEIVANYKGNTLALKFLDELSRLFARFRYPVSLPEEVGEALGVSLSNWLTPAELLGALAAGKICPTRLYRFMPRPYAEQAFTNARRQERFRNRSLYSYHVNDHWLEFILEFDGQQRLRRLYVSHHDLPQRRQLEIPLSYTQSTLIGTAELETRAL